MQRNTEAKRSELREVVERYPEYRLALGPVSNSNSEIIQTAGIECIQCQFRIPGFNAYIQTWHEGFLLSIAVNLYIMLVSLSMY